MHCRVVVTVLSHTYLLNDYGVVLSVVINFVNENTDGNDHQSSIDYVESLCTGFFHYW